MAPISTEMPLLPPEVLRAWVAHVSAVLSLEMATHKEAERRLADLHALPHPWSEEG